MRVAFLPCAPFFYSGEGKRHPLSRQGVSTRPTKKFYSLLCVSGKWTHFRWCAICWLNENANFSQPQIDTVSQSFGCKQAQCCWGESRRSEKADLFKELELLGKRRQRRRFFWVQARWALVPFPVLCVCVTYVWTVMVRSSETPKPAPGGAGLSFTSWLAHDVSSHPFSTPYSFRVSRCHNLFSDIAAPCPSVLT